jgi:membrane protein
MLSMQIGKINKNIKRTGKGIFVLLKDTVQEFVDQNAFHKGAALAYYTVFALPPILIIIINSVGVIYGENAVAGEVYLQLRGIVGREGAMEIERMVESVFRSDQTTFATIVSSATLFVAGTAVFIFIQDSLNEIWGVRPKPRNEYLKLLLNRVLSFAMIISLSFLLLVSLVINAALSAIGDFLYQNFTYVTVYLIHIVNFVISLVVIAVLFGGIYKFLPDARIRWRDVAVGALVTALLFTLGKSAISFYLGTSDLLSIYGAAGTVVMILTWVFFSAQILFFGAIFTLVYSRMYGVHIYPRRYAVRVVRQEVEVGKQVVNEDSPVKKVHLEDAAPEQEADSPAAP